MTAKAKIEGESGNVIFIPLNRLKKSPKNARKTPHSEAEIEALAASIAAKGLLQNLVVEPERDGEGCETGELPRHDWRGSPSRSPAAGETQAD